MFRVGRGTRWLVGAWLFALVGCVVAAWWATFV